MMAAPVGLPAAAPAPRETVYDLIASWAMRASPRRLAVWAIGGTVNAIGIALVLPGWWLVGALQVCVASIGAWGLASQRARALASAPAPSRLVREALQAARTAAFTVGTLAALILFFGAFFTLLGQRWGPSGG